MKSSCIQHPEKDRYVIIRHWQLVFCDGNYCAAALLSFYEYWHNIKLEIAKKSEKANKVAENHGERRQFDESLLQFHTSEELVVGILSLYSRTRVIEANKLLERLGVISVCSNPNSKYQLDRTRYVEFYPEICNSWLRDVYSLPN